MTERRVFFFMSRISKLINNLNVNEAIRERYIVYDNFNLLPDDIKNTLSELKDYNFDGANIYVTNSNNTKWIVSLGNKESLKAKDLEVLIKNKRFREVVMDTLIFDVNKKELDFIINKKIFSQTSFE